MSRASPAYVDPRSASDRAAGRHPYLLLGLVVLLGAALRLWSFGGMAGSDDASIAGLALDILQHGVTLPQSHYALRFALTIPLAGVFGLLGVGDWQIALLPFIVSMAGLVLTFAIGRRLGGDALGLLAALLLAIFPLNVLYATQYFPDAPQDVACAASFYFTLRMRESPTPNLWAVAAGLIWGVGYFVKIEAIFYGAVLLGMMYWDRRYWRQAFLVILVFGAVVAAENLFYLIRTGIFLYQIHVIRETATVMSLEYAGAQLWVFPKSWFITFYSFGLYYYLLAAAAVWVVVKRERRFYLPLVWVGVYLVWLQFGTTNPFSGHYSPKTHLDRYCEQLSVPMALLVAGFLLWLSGQGRRILTGALLAAIAATSFFFIVFNTLNLERQEATKLGLQYALAHDTFPLYLDTTSYDICSFLLWNDPRRDQIFSVQHHDFATGTTQVLDPGTLSGYLLLNTGFETFKAHRYFMKELDPEAMKARFPVVHTVDNPAPALAYREARLLKAAASWLPLAALRDKVQGTADELLAGEDVLIFRLGSAPGETQRP